MFWTISAMWKSFKIYENNHLKFDRIFSQTLEYTCGRNLPKLLYNAGQNYKIFSAIFDLEISISAIISANFGHMYTSESSDNFGHISNNFGQAMSYQFY